MLEGLDDLTLVGLVVLGALTLIGLIWLWRYIWGTDTYWQQMFCPEDRSSCHCRSCREERGDS